VNRNGQLGPYDPRRLTGVSVYRENEREFCVGDRIQFTAPNKQVGVANRELGTIEKIDVDSNIALRPEHGRTVQFNATEHRHFDHGYAVTSHSSQGITAVLINIDRSAPSQLLNSRFAYVAVSRVSPNAEIYTNDAIDLGQRLSGDVSESSAVEFSHPVGHSMSADHSTIDGDCT
jgi:ATP-dependent exoDNAse (exonuclease V) alpha subunit